MPSDSRTLGLTYLEFVSFLHTGAELGPDAYGLTNLLGMLGLRVSEACGVDIDDIGEERGHRVLARNLRSSTAISALRQQS